MKQQIIIHKLAPQWVTVAAEVEFYTGATFYTPHK